MQQIETSMMKNVKKRKNVVLTKYHDVGRVSCFVRSAARLCFGIAIRNPNTARGIKIAQNTHKFGKMHESLAKQHKIASPIKTKTASVP